MSMGGNSQLQELAQQIQELEEQKEILESEVEALQSQKIDIDDAIEAIEDLESDATVQVPLGGGAYVRATVENVDEIIVELGADYAAERGQEGAISTLESKQENLDDRIEDVRSQIAEIDTEADELEDRAQQMQAQQMQQMQQQPDDT